MEGGREEQREGGGREGIKVKDSWQTQLVKIHVESDSESTVHVYIHMYMYYFRTLCTVLHIMTRQIPCMNRQSMGPSKVCTSACALQLPEAHPVRGGAATPACGRYIWSHRTAQTAEKLHVYTHILSQTEQIN